MGRIYNFSAGPAIMPEPVLQKAADEMLNFKNSGMSVMEMSHRSKTYLSVFNDVELKLRDLMGIPNNYKVLFLQGGATLQFAAVAMNLMGRGSVADYAITGLFSKKAKQEAEKYGAVHVVCDAKPYSAIPAQSELDLSPDASYFHYCSNNTVYGTRWTYVPEANGAPLVCDMSSCILSEEIDVSRYGLIYAGAQKNMGPAGLTIVIVREDLAGSASAHTPTIMDYAVQIENESMLNTPPSYGIYLLGLVLDWVRDLGGLGAMREHNAKKADAIYRVLDASRFYTPVADKAYRSLMNVTFRTPTAEQDAAFVKEAAAAGLVNLAGHRAVGGIRASIYNAMPAAGADALARFMCEFAERQGDKNV